MCRMTKRARCSSVCFCSFVIEVHGKRRPETVHGQRGSVKMAIRRCQRDSQTGDPQTSSWTHSRRARQTSTRGGWASTCLRMRSLGKTRRRRCPKAAGASSMDSRPLLSALARGAKAPPFAASVVQGAQVSDRLLQVADNRSTPSLGPLLRDEGRSLVVDAHEVRGSVPKISAEVDVQLVRAVNHCAGRVTRWHPIQHGYCDRL